VGYNFIGDITGLFIRLAVVAFQNRMTKFDLIAIQGHPRSSILASIESPGATSY